MKFEVNMIVTVKTREQAEELEKEFKIVASEYTDLYAILVKPVLTQVEANERVEK